MNINCTLFLQIINFLITYWVLSVFVFKPALAVFDHNKRKKRFVEQNLQAKEDQLLKQEHELHEELLTFQRHVQTDYAPPQEKVPVVSEVHISFTRNDKEIEQLTHNVRDRIIQEVPRVR